MLTEYGQRRLDAFEDELGRTRDLIDRFKDEPDMLSSLRRHEQAFEIAVKALEESA